MAELDYKKYAIGTLTIALLISLGILALPGDNYICRDLAISKSCDRLSGTEKTCYPTPATRIGSKYCSTGWEEIMKVAESGLEGISHDINIGSAFECSFGGCVRIR